MLKGGCVQICQLFITISENSLNSVAPTKLQKEFALAETELDSPKPTLKPTLGNNLNSNVTLERWGQPKKKAQRYKAQLVCSHV